MSVRCRSIWIGRIVSSCTSDACFPPGPAVPVDGGYRVSGQWAFGSGCQHTHWLQTMGIITDHGALRMGADECQENTCGVAVVSRKMDGYCCPTLFLVLTSHT